MKKLTLADIQNIIEYERSRKSFRERIIALKKHRRVAVGKVITLVFENRDTVRFQVQEMARVERLVDDTQIQAELDTYNILIPAAGALSATLLVDITDQSMIRETLDSLIGLHRMVALEIGSDHIPAKFDPSQFSDDRISAVQYITFTMTEKQRAAFCDAAIPARIVITHPNYHHTVEFTAEARAELIRDLS